MNIPIILQPNMIHQPVQIQLIQNISDKSSLHHRWEIMMQVQDLRVNLSLSSLIFKIQSISLKPKLLLYILSNHKLCTWGVTRCQEEIKLALLLVQLWGNSIVQAVIQGIRLHLLFQPALHLAIVQKLFHVKVQEIKITVIAIYIHILLQEN